MTKKERNKIYVEENKEKKREYDKKYYEENKEKKREYQKEYQKTKISEKREYDKKYREKNKIRISENKNKRCIERRKYDVSFRIKCNLRARVKNAIKGFTKSAHTIELIGCSAEELIIHLANQFTEGMSWENYGEWHIDHIRPCSSFNLINEEEQKSCFHYTNLQPLWALDNIRKSDKWDEKII